MFKSNLAPSIFKFWKCKTLTKNVFLISLSLLIVDKSLAQVFTKITTGPVVTEQNNSYYTSWGDYDNDRDLDLFHSLYFASANNPNGNSFLFQNNCNGDFSRITKIPDQVVTNGLDGPYSYWIDYDNDGDLDLYVGPKFLYENQGDGSFLKVVKEITNIPNYPIAIETAAWADYDNDGILDVYFGKQELYKGNAQKDFTTLNVAPFTDNNSSSSSNAVAWADYNNDGFMDMYVCNAWASSGPAALQYLYKNNGDGTFTSVITNTVMTVGLSPYGCAWADIDNDLDLDLYVSTAFAGGDQLFKNNGDGTFTKITTGPIANTSNVGQGGGSFADYDNDGDLDLYVPNFNNNTLYDNNGDGTYTKNTTEIIVNDASVESYGACWADYDNDGDLDLFVPTAFGDPNDRLYKNNVYQNNITNRNWFKLHCTGITSNRDAIGVRIYIKATINGSSKWQMREINANSTRGGESGGASGHVVHFGLGDAAIIDSLKIVWPASGIKQYFVNVNPNRFVEITENINSIVDIAPCKADLPIANPGYVSGKMYTDINNNCEFNEGIDFPIANKIVRAEPGAYYAFTDDNGNYTIDLPAGRYTVRQNPQIENFELSSCQTDSIYSVTVTTGDTLKNKDYAYVQRTIPCNGAYNLTIQGIGIVAGNCPSGQLLQTPCPGNLYQYCFTIINNSTLPTNANSILTVNLPFDFHIQNVNNQCLGTIVPGNNLNIMNINIPDVIPVNGNCIVCVTAFVGPLAFAPFVTTADFNNTATNPNLVLNGDFTLGNVNFGSQYNFTCMPGAGNYCVGSTPTAMNGYWVQTARSPINFLYADASTNPNLDVWSQNITVLPNTRYNFSAWFNNLIRPISDYPDPNLQLRINNVAVAATGPIPENPDVWIRSIARWCSGTQTTANLAIRAINAWPSGHDFGIDDIDFREFRGAAATLTQPIACACDPNDKTASPKGCGPNGNIAKNQILTYKVRFENTGSGPAHNVLLSDKLDSDLDISTLQILASSHPITGKQILPDNNLIIKFDGIELPSNAIDADGAKGFFIFTIAPKTGLPDGTVITNQTGIYFDQNEVVLTDVTKNTLYDKPEPDARFDYKHACSQTGLVYDFNYTGSTPDNATYAWTFEDATPNTSASQNPTNIVFSNNTGYKLVTLTVNRNGCSEYGSDTIKVISGLSDNGNKVTVCHNGQAITINQNALAVHLSHGDCVGGCVASSNNARKASLIEKDVRQLFNMILLPNPSNDACKIQIQGLQKDGDNLVIELYNYAGQLVKTINSQEFEITIDTKELSSGIYLVKAKCNESVLVDKLIVEH